MSRTDEGSVLTASQRSQQLVLRSALLRDLLTLWSFWNGDPKTWPRFVQLATTLVRDRSQVSAGLGARYYERFREVEKIAGVPTVVLPDPPPVEKVVRSLTQTGLVGTIRGLSAGYTPEAALRNGFVRLAGAASRHVLDGGRGALILSTGADQQALGWARVTGGNPCGFCAMLASRGPVYSENTADFEAHDNCGCTAEPEYEGSAWPGRAEDYRSIWSSTTAGLSGTEAMNAFRKVIEGG